MIRRYTTPLIAVAATLLCDRHAAAGVAAAIPYCCHYAPAPDAPPLLITIGATPCLFRYAIYYAMIAPVLRLSCYDIEFRFDVRYGSMPTSPFTTLRTLLFMLKAP